MPFFKRSSNVLLTANSFVTGPNFELKEEDHATYNYPVDGWFWFTDLNAAMLGMALPPAVPESITKRQALQALILAGKDEEVETILNAIPGIEGKLARAEWEQSSVVDRQRPLVLQMGTALGMSESDLDQLFASAAML